MTMNLRPMVKYQLHDYWTSGLVFFTVNVAVILMAFISTELLSTGGGASYTGYGFACGIFMLVMGLVLPRQSMRLGGQVSISRRTSFCGLMVSSLTASLALALAGEVLIACSQWVAHPTADLFFSDLYGLFYAGSATALTLAEHVCSILFSTTLMLVCFALGLFLTFLFWKLGKVGKIVVSCGLPGLLIGLPILLSTFEVPLSPITQPIERLVTACVNSPWVTMGVFLVTALVLTGIGWFIICRTNIRGTSLK